MKTVRARVVQWIVLCLLVVAGGWWLWHEAGRAAAEKKLAHRTEWESVHSGSTAPDLLAGAQSSGGVGGTNRFAWRLSNTAEPIGELVNDPQAILLENALIDTRPSADFCHSQTFAGGGRSGRLHRAGARAGQRRVSRAAGAGGRADRFLHPEQRLSGARFGGQRAGAGGQVR